LTWFNIGKTYVWDQNGKKKEQKKFAKTKNVVIRFKSCNSILKIFPTGFKKQTKTTKFEKKKEDKKGKLEVMGLKIQKNRSYRYNRSTKTG